MKSLAAITVTMAFLAFCGLAAADVIITMENRDLTSDPPTVTTGRVFVAGDKLMMEVGDSDSESENGPGQMMIYRGGEEQILIVEPARKSYMVLDKEAMAGVSEQMNQAMKQMEEELAKLPEEQRKMMEERMGSMFKAQSAADRPLVETKETGEKKTIDGYSCVGYENLVDGEKTSQMWVADLNKVGIPQESFDVFKNMARFMQDLMSSLPALARYGAGEQAFQGLQDIDGFPVLFQHFEGDDVMYESHFKSVEKKKLDPSTFEVPEGYTRTALGQGG